MVIAANNDLKVVFLLFFVNTSLLKLKSAKLVNQLQAPSMIEGKLFLCAPVIQMLIFGHLSAILKSNFAMDMEDEVL